ncbi:MAG: GDSL-type esterase/lipase family protein [Cyanobacteria bacterium P01_A01_bin.105]
MTDLLLGLSQLAPPSPDTAEQRSLPVSPEAVSPIVREAAADNTPQPQVTTQSPDVPQFSPDSMSADSMSADSTPTLNLGPKLQQLRESVPRPANSASLDELLISAMDSEIAIADLRQGLQGAPNTNFDFTAALSSDAPEINLDRVQNGNFSGGESDRLQLRRGLAPEPPGATFEFDIRHRDTQERGAAATTPAPVSLVKPADLAPNPPPTPRFAVPREGSILSYATTPSALAMAEQQLPPLTGPRPGSGSQLYQQRQAALQAGTLHTRLSPDSFYEQWVTATPHPTYQQWQALLSQEAQAVAQGQGNNGLSIVVGDSLSQWLPTELLPQDRFWLNQGISGDTTQGILNRLSTFADTRPDVIHVMAGVNDLKNGASDDQVVANLAQIMQQLRQQHPEARVVVHSILPTRLASIPNDRIRALNRQIEQTALTQQVMYLNLQPSFVDDSGQLRYELTTDGLHLSRLGYQVWQIALLSL